MLHDQRYCPYKYTTGFFTFLESQEQEVGEFHRVRECRAPNLGAREEGLKSVRIGKCQNAFFFKIGKCQNRNASESESVRIGKFQKRKVSESESVKIGKCQNAFFIKIGKCKNGKLSEIRKCQNRKVSKLESVRIGKCQNLKVSEFESVRMHFSSKLENY